MKVLYCFGAVIFSVLAVSHADDWREKFNRERRSAFSVKTNTIDDAKKFYVLEGENRGAIPGLLPLEEIRVEKHFEFKPLAAEPKVRKKKMVKIRINNLLEKSREAYSNGQLEEARRYYKLIQKADPSSVEAADRLAEIEREMN